MSSNPWLELVDCFLRMAEHMPASKTQKEVWRNDLLQMKKEILQFEEYIMNNNELTVGMWNPTTKQYGLYNPKTKRWETVTKNVKSSAGSSDR